MQHHIADTTVNGFSVEVKCKSRSGKQTYSPQIDFDDNTGSYNITFDPYPSAREVENRIRKEKLNLYRVPVNNRHYLKIL